MKSKQMKIIVPILTIVGLLLMIAWMAGAFNDKIPPGNIVVNTINTTNAIAVEKREYPIFETAPASIEAKQSTIISSRILARIRKVHVRAGDMVKKGQILIELEQTDLQSRVLQADAAIQSVSARLMEAKKTFSRAENLTEKGLLAQSDLDKAQANREALAADLSKAKQALREVNIALRFAHVTAPISGRIVDRFAEPGDTAQPGVQLLSLYNPFSLRVEAYVREELALSLSSAQSLDVVIPALQQNRSSNIEELVPAGRAGSRSFLVKSRLQNTQDLLPGMYAQLRVPAGVTSVLIVPSKRVAQVGQLNVVRVLSKGVVERRFVRIGKVYPGAMVDVVSGLAEGEWVLPSR